MKKFIVVEVGSTVTKAYLYDYGDITAYPQKTISFKPHFKEGKLDDGDINELSSYVANFKKTVDKIFVYGTSIFRNIDETEKKRFLKIFTSKTGVNFNIVSSEQEALYTVSGVILGNDYTGRLGIMIGGGGSVEIIIVENKKIIEKHLQNFGAVSINEKFKNINDFKPSITIKEVDDFCEANISNIKNKADILVTAGGDTKYCQECMAAEFLRPNIFYKDRLQPHMIKVEDFIKADTKFMLEQDINVYKNFSVYQGVWWDYARGFNSCIRAAAKKVGAKYEIPSRINMCLGIINELKNK